MARSAAAGQSRHSSIRIERFSETIERVYRSRYKGLPPHADVGEEAEEAFEEEPGAS